VRDVVRALLIAATLLFLTIPSQFGATSASYTLATLLMFGANIALTAIFRTGDLHEPAAHIRRTAALVATTVASLLLVIAARAWLYEMLIYPHDPLRADMLIVIQEGIRRMLRGQNPYTMYHIPWDATLPYGPVLWLPYAVPYMLRVDVRFVALLGELFVPVACALSAMACAWRGRYGAAIASVVLLAAIAESPDLRGFSSIAHTPSYWPGIALLAWLVSRERWLTAATICGLLIVARTTMVAVAPVLLIAVWQQDRERAPRAFVLLTLATVLPYLPFAVWNPAALKYALYGSYQLLMKGFVWTSTTWAHNTIGVTGLLLRNGLERFAELTQLLAMLVTYRFAWRAIRSGARPLPWMALALFVFSTTTLWPVHYVYFDVTMLWMAAALADGDWVAWRRVFPAWTVTLAAAASVALLVVVVSVPSNPTIDVGIGATRALLYKGFSLNEGTDRTFAWVEGTSAEILVGRRTRSEADIDLELEPYLATAQSTQQISVVLNGVVLGTSLLHPGWHAITFRAPATAWRIGVNELVLSLSNAVSPREAGTGDDIRRLSVAIDRLTVRTVLARALPQQTRASPWPVRGRLAFAEERRHP